MNKPHLLLIAAFFLVFSAAVPGQRQVHPGVELFVKAKHAEAVRSLSEAVKQSEFKSNPEIWNYLGLAYIETGELKKGRKALEKTVALDGSESKYHVNLAYVYLLLRQTDKGRSEAKKAIELDPKNVSAYSLRGFGNLWEGELDAAESDADQIIALSPDNPEGYILKSRVAVGRMGDRVTAGATIKQELPLLKEALDVVKRGTELTKNHAGHQVILKEYESIAAFYNYFSKDRTIPLVPSAPEPGTTPVKILNKPKASYTEKARQSLVSGKIRIAVLLGASGKVEQILLLKRLGFGLDEEAMRAANQIRFEPATKDGKPVSKVVIFEYGFDIY